MPKNQPAQPPAVPERRTLTGEEQLFVQEYWRTGNPVKAYLAVWPFTAKRVAPGAAKQLLDLPHIQQEMEQWQDRMNKRFNLSRERVMQELARLILFDPRQLYRDDGSMKLPHELDADTAAAISGFESIQMGTSKGNEEGETIEITVKKVKWADKHAAIKTYLEAQGWKKQVDTERDSNPLANLLKQIGERSAIPVVHMDGQAEEVEDA
jgi:phage terminase small subunit